MRAPSVGGPLYGGRYDCVVRISHSARPIPLFVIAMSLVSCGLFNEDAPQAVPGTSAFVNDKKVSPLHEGQYIGQLQKVNGGRACKGRAGSESSGSINVALHIDDECRVFVESIDL